MPDKFLLPVPTHCVITQDYAQHKARAIANGWAWKPGMAGSAWYYPGIDYAPLHAYSGGDIPVYAANKGKVTRKVVGDSGYGNAVYIDHGDGDVTIYAHLNSISVSVGDKVSAGRVIGIMGWTGNVWPAGIRGRHLHFELRRNNVPINPQPMITIIEERVDEPIEKTELPIIPDLPRAQSLYDYLVIRTEPRRTGWGGNLMKNQPVKVIAVHHEKDNIWLQIGHKQFVALLYEGQYFMQWIK